jgi:hypothetical protein
MLAAIIDVSVTFPVAQPAAIFHLPANKIFSENSINFKKSQNISQDHC